MISWLERFAEQLKSGTLLVDGETVRAPEKVEAEVTSKSKKRHRKIDLKLEWAEEKGSLDLPRQSVGDEEALTLTELPAEAASTAEEPSVGKNGKKREYDAHVLVCCGGDCRKRGSKELKKAFKQEFKSQGTRRIKVNSVDCLGLCKKGPNAILYPEGTWHTGVGKGDVPQIVARHIERKPAATGAANGNNGKRDRLSAKRS